MGCMCIECKHLDILRDNHDNLHEICTCVESPNFLKKMSIVWDDCDSGEVETADEEDEE